MITVTISHIGVDGHEPTVSQHRADKPFKAVERAIAKAFGKSAELDIASATSLPDRGLWYGQVVKPDGSCISRLIRVSTDERVPAGKWSLKAGTGHYQVWQAGPNQYRVALNGEVVRYCSQLGEASAQARRLHEQGKMI